jgi:hypothetical protein
MPGPIRRRRRGFLLLVVMACVTIAALSMAGTAGQSLRLARQALAAQQELQQRWGVVSCQHTLLRGAPALFAEWDTRARRAKTKQPVRSTVHASVLLGQVRFDMLLADEDAKVNLNAVYHRRGLVHLQRVVQRLVGPGSVPVRLMAEVASLAAASPLGTRLQPGKREGVPPPARAFHGWGQVFDLAAAQPPGAAVERLPDLTTRVTCWGRGRMNVRRAADELVLEVCRLVVADGAARRLLRKYREDPQREIRWVMDQAQLSTADATALAELLGNDSWCYSLWGMTAGAGFGKHWLAVAERDDEGAIRTARFEF